MFHVSDVKRYLRCSKLFCLYNEDPQDTSIPYIRSGEDISLQFAKKLKITNYYLGHQGDDKDRFRKHFDEYEWFIKARLEAYGLRVKLPIIHKVKKGVDVYFTYYGLFPKNGELIFYRLHLEVLRLNGFRINNVYIMHLNGDFLYDGQALDYDKLFVISSYLYNRNNNPNYYLNNELRHRIDIKKLIQEMRESDLNNCPTVKSKRCLNPERCPFYQKCFGDDSLLADDSIYTLTGGPNKDELYQNGIHYLKDISDQLSEISRLQFAQIMASRNDGIFYDLYPLKAYMEQLEGEEISFIDFEWDRYLIPPYKDLKPLDVVCFEFALFILKKDGSLEHHTFIADGDCREEFIKKLLKHLPKSGPIIAYNAFGAEVLRLKELANQFPDYSDELNALTLRFKDLAFPFINGLIYHTAMRGEFNLKRIVAVVSDKTYDDLNIRDGMEAVIKWRNSDASNQQEIIDDLKAYCSLDAYGLYLIYSWLKHLLKA